MAVPLLNIWLGAVADWSGVTPANIVTWAVMVGGWVAFWVKLKDRVDGHSEMFVQQKKETAVELAKQDERICEQARVIDEMKTQGSPASRQSSIVMNSRIESQNGRLMRVEDAILEFAAIKADVGWIKLAVQERHK